MPQCNREFDQKGRFIIVIHPLYEVGYIEIIFCLSKPLVLKKTQYDRLQLARADQGSVKAPCQYRLAMGSINEGSDFSMHSATKFKCNFVVIDVVHSGIKMTGSYFSEFRWDEKCCNSLHEYKDYSKTHPLPQYAQMINFIPITKCSPKWYCDACRTARAWRKRMAQRCPVNRQHRVFFNMGSLGF